MNVGELPCICVHCDDVCMAEPGIEKCSDCRETANGFCHRRDAIRWCKDRALAYVDQGDIQGAFASFASDVTKHPATAPLSGIIAGLGMPLLLSGHLSTREQMRQWIEGFA